MSKSEGIDEMTGKLCPFNGFGDCRSDCELFIEQDDNGRLCMQCAIALIAQTQVIEVRDAVMDIKK